MPTLNAGGSTAMVNALNDAIDKGEARKQWYKSTNQAYYRPWIILMTDGEPDDDQNVKLILISHANLFTQVDCILL